MEGFVRPASVTVQKILIKFVLTSAFKARELILIVIGTFKFYGMPSNTHLFSNIVRHYTHTRARAHTHTHTHTHTHEGVLISP